MKRYRIVLCEDAVLGPNVYGVQSWSWHSLGWRWYSYGLTSEQQAREKVAQFRRADQTRALPRIRHIIKP